MTDPAVRDYMLRDLATLKDHILAHERLLEQVTVEITRREENSGMVEEEKLEKAGLEGALRTLNLLKGAKEVELQLGKNAAGAYLGENIGKKG